MTDSFWLYLLRRLLYIPATLVIITATLYALMMVAPAEERASLFLPPRLPSNLTQERLQNVLERIIEENGLDDPFPVQYGRWAWNLLRGDWGFSPTFGAPVLDLLQARAGTTLEIAVFALLTLIPIGLVSGLRAGWRPRGFWDWFFRGLAYVGGAIPPFILGLFLLSIFYVGLGWFSPGRLSIRTDIGGADEFIRYTGFLTIDGLLNGRADVAKDALNHLVLPVVALSIYYWATLGRVTRASTMDELGKAYILAARARGLGKRRIMWRHTLRNVLVPGYTSMALAAASIITGVFVVEVVFNIKGLSELITTGFGPTPDAALVLGFAVFSVLLVVPIMFILDLLKSIADPRLRHDE
jgi:peptide/nickel transport system permease protein